MMVRTKKNTASQDEEGDLEGELSLIAFGDLMVKMTAMQQFFFKLGDWQEERQLALVWIFSSYRTNQIRTAIIGPEVRKQRAQ